MFYLYRGSLKSREKFLRFVIGRILLRAWFSPASSAKKIGRALRSMRKPLVILRKMTQGRGARSEP